LPCMHVCCRGCLFGRLGKTKNRHSMYKNPRRLECRICHWPVYLRSIGKYPIFTNYTRPMFQIKLVYPCRHGPWSWCWFNELSDLLL
jgi:hypothetical protein